MSIEDKGVMKVSDLFIETSINKSDTFYDTFTPACVQRMTM